jgi:hypothetical protein
MKIDVASLLFFAEDISAMSADKILISPFAFGGTANRLSVSLHPQDFE